MIRFFRHYVPLNLLLLVLIEALIVGGAIFVGVGARFFDGGVIPESLNPLLPKALTFTAVMLGLMTASGLYDLEWQGGVRALLQRLGLSFGLGLVTMSLLFYFFPALLVGRGAEGVLGQPDEIDGSQFAAPGAPSCCRSAWRCWAFCSVARCSSAGRGQERSRPAPWSSAPAAALPMSNRC